jgi:hypothetical protein
VVSRVLELINTHQSNLIDATVNQKLNLGVEDAKMILIERAENERKRLEEERKEQLRRYERQKKERMVINHWIIHGSALTAAGATGALAQVVTLHAKWRRILRFVAPCLAEITIPLIPLPEI